MGSGRRQCSESDKDHPDLITGSVPVTRQAKAVWSQLSSRQTVTAALTATRRDPLPSSDDRPRLPSDQNDSSTGLAGFS
jgi:hypothetical protein